MKTFDELTMLLASVSTQQKEKYAGWTFEEIYNDLSGNNVELTPDNEDYQA